MLTSSCELLIIISSDEDVFFIRILFLLNQMTMGKGLYGNY